MLAYECATATQRTLFPGRTCQGSKHSCSASTPDFFRTTGPQIASFVRLRLGASSAEVRVNADRYHVRSPHDVIGSYEFEQRGAKGRASSYPSPSISPGKRSTRRRRTEANGSAIDKTHARLSSVRVRIVSVRALSNARVSAVSYVAVKLPCNLYQAS